MVGAKFKALRSPFTVGSFANLLDLSLRVRESRRLSVDAAFVNISLPLPSLLSERLPDTPSSPSR